MNGEQVPRRVAVTSPRMRAMRTTHRYPLTREIDEQTQLGAVYMRSLMRAQFRLGLLVCVAIIGTLVGLPVLFALASTLNSTHVFELGLPWLLLGVLVYPALLAGGWFYVWQAERNERDFAEFVERS